MAALAWRRSNGGASETGATQSRWRKPASQRRSHSPEECASTAVAMTRLRLSVTVAFYRKATGRFTQVVHELIAGQPSRVWADLRERSNARNLHVRVPRAGGAPNRDRWNLPNFDAVSASLLRRALSGAYLYYCMTSASETVAPPQGRLFDCWGWRSMIAGDS